MSATLVEGEGVGGGNSNRGGVEVLEGESAGGEVLSFLVKVHHCYFSQIPPISPFNTTFRHSNGLLTYL